MGPQMALEGLQPAECPLTYLTLEALLLGVNVSVVLHEVAELWERFTTVHTLVGTFSYTERDAGQSMES